MKLLSIVIVIFIIVQSTNARMRLYSRTLAEKRVTDSLHAIDSLRIARQIADSMRVADSMMIARYRVADVAYKDEMIKKNEAINAAMSSPIDASERIESEDVDNISARTIIIDENSPYAATIDSIQHRVDSLNDNIHDHDGYLKKMKTYHISEKKRYISYLISNSMKDSTSIRDYCNQLYQMYTAKLDLLVAIRNSQSANRKAFITYHIEEQRRRMAELSEYIVALSPALPFQPESHIEHSHK